MERNIRSITKPEYCKHGSVEKYCVLCRIEKDPDRPLCKHGMKVGLACEECREVYREEELRKKEEWEEKRRKDLIENTDKYLRRMGIGEKYVNCRLDNYSGNDKLIDIVRSLPLSESVLLIGQTGCGKTHLAVAIMAEIVKAGIVGGKAFRTAPDLLMQIRASFNSAQSTEEKIVDFYSGVDYLVIDDLGAEKSTEYSITTLYIILDRRIRELKTTIITTNLNMNQIEEYLGARIASRLSEMKSIKINMPDYRKKRTNSNVSNGEKHRQEVGA